MLLGVKAAGAYGWHPTIITMPLSRKLGALTLLDPSGPTWPVRGRLYLTWNLVCFILVLPLASEHFPFINVVSSHSTWRTDKVVSCNGCDCEIWGSDGSDSAVLWEMMSCSLAQVRFRLTWWLPHQAIRDPKIRHVYCDIVTTSVGNLVSCGVNFHEHFDPCRWIYGTVSKLGDFSVSVTPRYP